MKKQLIGIALIFLGILFTIADTFLFAFSRHSTVDIGFILGVIGLIIVIFYAFMPDKEDK
ncbi:MAG: hypothetical protein PWQ93_342 [Clostridiales bacterium]|nr:hypothetical protein [Clostridiales bacterium]